MNTENLIKLSYAEVKEIVSERLLLPITNTSVTARMGKSEIRIFPQAIDRAFKGEAFFALVPKKAEKIAPGDWRYDMSSFKIYKIDSIYLNNQNIYNSESSNSSGLISINLEDESIVYTSDSGLVETLETKKEFNLRELACLELKLPESGTPWLDTLITKYNIKNNKI